MTKSYQLTNFVQIGNIKKLFKTIEPPSKIVLKSFDESITIDIGEKTTKIAAMGMEFTRKSPDEFIPLRMVPGVLCVFEGPTVLMPYVLSGISTPPALCQFSRQNWIQDLDVLGAHISRETAIGYQIG